MNVNARLKDSWMHGLDIVDDGLLITISCSPAQHEHLRTKSHSSKDAEVTAQGNFLGDGLGYLLSSNFSKSLHLVDKDMEIMLIDIDNAYDSVVDLELDEVLVVEGSPLVAELQPRPKLEYYPDAIDIDYEKVVFFALDLKEWLSVHFRNSGYNPETGWMFEYVFDWFERFEITGETINWLFGNRRPSKVDYVRWTGTVYLRVEDDLDSPEDV